MRSATPSANNRQDHWHDEPRIGGACLVTLTLRRETRVIPGPKQKRRPSAAAAHESSTSRIRIPLGMQRIFLGSLVAAVGAVSGGGVANATDDSGAFYVSPMAQYHVLDSGRISKDNFGAQIGLGYNLLHGFAVEGDISRGNFSITGSTVEQRLTGYSLDVIKKFFPDSVMRPYVLVGAGEMDDTLNAGERSDRLMVRWDFADETRAPSGTDPNSGFQVLGIAGDVAKPNPSSVRPPPGDGLAVIRIPADYAALREQDASLGTAWRDALADAMESCFGAGLVASEFTRDSVYLFR
jgi:hypothetical protein